MKLTTMMLTAALLIPLTSGAAQAQDRKARLRAQVARQERAQAEAMRQYQINAQRQYERMLPYMMEQQRQQMQRQSELERNQALHRMAAAAEYEAQYYAWWVSKQRAR
jgi:hypothetical protein